MFERFTDRARRVVVLAQDEAAVSPTTGLSSIGRKLPDQGDEPAS